MQARIDSIFCIVFTKNPHTTHKKAQSVNMSHIIAYINAFALSASRKLLVRIGWTMLTRATRGKTIKHLQRHQHCPLLTVLCATYPYVDLSVCQTSASRLQSVTRWNTHKELLKFGHASGLIGYNHSWVMWVRFAFRCFYFIKHEK